MSDPIEVRRPRDGTERSQLAGHIRKTWGDLVARRGEVVDPTIGHLFGAWDTDRLVGVASARIGGGECEVVALEAFEARRGVGSALMDAVRRSAEEAGCRTLWLVTTNDNLPALAFYQRWGMELVALRPGAAVEARRHLKPSIPVFGHGGLPIRDELELELLLTR